MNVTPSQKWHFRSRFRRDAFGWKSSKLAIERIYEAVSEITAVAKVDKLKAAEGAVLFLERVSPAISQVDSSSGALGSACYQAVSTLVDMIAEVEVNDATRRKWLERLYEAVQDDDPPYIESLMDHWGAICRTPEIASQWADDLLPIVRRIAHDRKNGLYGYFKGAPSCYSALFTAERFDEILDLVAQETRPYWGDVLWAGKVYLARGLVDEAITCVERYTDMDYARMRFSIFAEEALLAVGRHEEAYSRFAILANQRQTYLATYRSIAKKYPMVDPDKILSDLIATTPGKEGKWFATAKTLKRYDLAIGLAWSSPCDHRTLYRASRDMIDNHPAFALQVAQAALKWIAQGYGYEVTSLEVKDLHALTLKAGITLDLLTEVNLWSERLLADTPQASWMASAMGQTLQKL